MIIHQVTKFKLLEYFINSTMNKLINNFRYTEPPLTLTKGMKFSEIIWDDHGGVFVFYECTITDIIKTSKKPITQDYIKFTCEDYSIGDSSKKNKYIPETCGYLVFFTDDLKFIE